MNLGEVYTKNQIDKLGNTLIFLCDKMNPLSKTHLLKLVFIIEEISIKKYGMPFFDLRFDVWKLGPVSKDLFVELSGQSTLLADYIYKEQGDNLTITSKKAFCDDEFTDIEISLLEEISERFLYCTATELINFTHREKTPWYQTALKNGVLELLESGQMTTTNIEIKLSETIQDDEYKLALYHSHKDFLTQSRTFKF